MQKSEFSNKHSKKSSKIEEEDEGYVPFLSETSATGRSKISSIKNLVTQEGQQTFIDRVTTDGKNNYRK